MDVLSIICICVMVFSFYILVKNFNTYDACEKISGAIYAYHMDMLYHDKYKEMDLVDYDDMKDYLKVLFNLFDWGYKHILPKDKFELIEKYIKD